MKLPWHRKESGERSAPDIIELVEAAEAEHDHLVQLLRERLEATS